MWKLLVAVALIALASCFGLRVDAQAGQPEVKVGVLIPLSGPGAEFGAQEEQSFRAVIEKNNADGGAGTNISVVIRDTKSDPTEAARLANQLILDEHVVALVTGRGSDTLAVADLAARSKVPVLSMESTLSTTDPSASYFAWVFRVCTTATDDAKLLRDVIVKNGHRRLAIFFSEDAFGEQAANLVKKLSLEKNDIEIALMASAPLRATDLTAPALAVRRSNADSILILSAAGATTAGTFLRKLRELGSTIPAYGSAALAQPATIKAAGEASNGMMMAAIINSDNAGPLKALFDLLRPSGGPRGFGSLLGAAAAATIIEGLKAGASDGASLRDAIERLPAFSPYSAGPVRYSADNHDGWGPQNLLLVQVENGRFVNVPR